MSDTLAVVTVTESGLVRDALGDGYAGAGLFDGPGSYAILPVASGATVTAEKIWRCVFAQDHMPHPCLLEDIHRKKYGCGWVTMVREVPADAS